MELDTLKVYRFLFLSSLYSSYSDIAIYVIMKADTELTLKNKS